MQIAVELPNDFMALCEKQTVGQEMRLSYALQLFKNSKIQKLHSLKRLNWRALITKNL